MNIRDLPYNLGLRILQKFDLVKPFTRRDVSLTCYDHPEFTHTFFGYYDRSPWNEHNSKLLFLATNAEDYRDVSSVANVGYVDIASGELVNFYETSSWNFQQGAQQQWLNDDRVFVNDRLNDVPICRVVGTDGVILAEYPFHGGMLHRQSGLVCSYDFDTLYSREIDYGYYGLRQNTNLESLVRIFSIENGGLLYQLSLTDILEIHPNRDEILKRHVWVQHVKFNPSGNRVLFMLRSRSDDGSDWNTRVNSDLLIWDFSDNKLTLGISSDVWSKGANHPIWKDDDTVMLNLFVSDERRIRTVELNTNNGKIKVLVSKVVGTGHPTSMDEQEVVLTDSYFFKQVQRLHILCPDKCRRWDLARYRFNTNYKGSLRCDLHPRWNGVINNICFDSTMNGKRCLYVMDLNEFFVNR